MKATVKVEKEIDFKILRVEAGIRYWEDAEVDGVEDNDGELIPCRVDDLWKPIIDIETGIITNWKQGITANIHYKVCDSGRYFLESVDGLYAFELEGYVPSCMSPKEDGYGDYIIMDIDENGQIKNWKFRLSDIEGFTQQED